MDKRLQQLKEEYQQIPIPAELNLVVNQALRARKRKRNSMRWLAGVSAAAMAFVITINMSTTVANAFTEIPGVGNIVKVFIFKQYTMDDETYHADLKVPAIGNLENKELELGLNQKYLEENRKLYEEFLVEVEALKQAGGGHLGIDSGFEVKTDNDEILAIGRYVVNTVGSSSTTIKYDTIDKKNEIVISLPMLFQDDRYIDIISANIKKQMKEQMAADPSNVYWIATEENPSPVESFERIENEQNFYINPDGKLVIVFNKYDVAPGYMGVVEFVIPTDVLSDVLVSRQYIR